MKNRAAYPLAIVAEAINRERSTGSLTG